MAQRPDLSLQGTLKCDVLRGVTAKIRPSNARCRVVSLIASNSSTWADQMEAVGSAFSGAGKALKSAGQSIKYKVTGQKYHDNLLGESLHDVLRKATAKTLEAPDTTCNQQVRGGIIGA